MSYSRSPTNRRARPPRRRGAGAALLGLILIGGGAAWGWLASNAAQPARPATVAPASAPTSATTGLRADAPDRSASPQPMPTPSSASATAKTPVTMPAAASATSPRAVASAVASAFASAVASKAPAAGPSALRPSAASTDVIPSFDIVRVTSRGEAVLAGRAAPSAVVAVSAGGRVIAQAHADADGQWVALPDTDLPSGPTELTLSATDALSASPVAAAATLLVVVPERAVAPSHAGQPQPTDPTSSAAAPSAVLPAPATVPGRAADLAPVAPTPTQATAMALLLPRDGPPRLMQRPEAGGARATPSGVAIASKLNLDQVDYTTAGAIRFAGTAHPGVTVRLYVDEVAVGEALADAEGHWALEPASAIAVGPHRVRVDEIGIHGQVMARIALPFERSAIAPADLAADLGTGRVVVQPRQNLWRIARRAYGRGIEYTLIFDANREQIADPARIFPGQIFAIPERPAALAK